LKGGYESCRDLGALCDRGRQWCDMMRRLDELMRYLSFLEWHVFNGKSNGRRVNCTSNVLYFAQSLLQ
jgi:hypothetical protein